MTTGKASNFTGTDIIIFSDGSIYGQVTSSGGKLVNEMSIGGSHHAVLHILPEDREFGDDKVYEITLKDAVEILKPILEQRERFASEQGVFAYKEGVEDARNGTIRPGTLEEPV